MPIHDEDANGQSNDGRQNQNPARLGGLWHNEGYSKKPAAGRNLFAKHNCGKRDTINVNDWTSMANIILYPGNSTHSPAAVGGKLGVSTQFFPGCAYENEHLGDAKCLFESMPGHGAAFKTYAFALN
jgi:hypothetical protein